MSAQTLAAQVATVVADRRIFRVTPSTVIQKLRSLVELKATEPTKYVWQFKGANAGFGVRWAQADFQPGRAGPQGGWQLLQIRLGLAPADRDFRGLYEELSAEITKQFGKSSKGISEENDRRRSWHVAKYWEVAIREGEFESPVDQHSERLVLIEVAVLQGEAE